MKFIKILKHLFNGKKIRSESYLEGDHFVLIKNQLMFGGPTWNGYEKSEFQEDVLLDKTWRVLNE